MSENYANAQGKRCWESEVEISERVRQCRRKHRRRLI